MNTSKNFRTPKRAKEKISYLANHMVVVHIKEACCIICSANEVYHMQLKMHTYVLLDGLEEIDKSVSPPGGPGSGFRPSFKAFLISAAFQTAYFCFCSIWKMQHDQHKSTFSN